VSTASVVVCPNPGAPSRPKSYTVQLRQWLRHHLDPRIRCQLRPVHITVSEALTERMIDPTRPAVAWPNLDTIAEDAFCDDRTARRAIKKLCSLGIFTRERASRLTPEHPAYGRTRGYVYTLLLPDPAGRSTGHSAAITGRFGQRDTGQSVHSHIRRLKSVSLNPERNQERDAQPHSLSGVSDAAIEKLFLAWKAGASKPDATLTGQRRTSFEQMLRLGMPVADVEAAMHGVKVALQIAPHEVMGKTPGPTVLRTDSVVPEIRWVSRCYLEPADLVRYPDKLERLRDMWRSREAEKQRQEAALEEATARSLAAQRWLEERPEVPKPIESEQPTQATIHTANPILGARDGMLVVKRELARMGIAIPVATA
jgi:hypothetical protein